MNVLIKFRHGLGDAVQLTAVLRHLAHYHPEWQVDVAALPGKHSAYFGLCRQVFVLGRDRVVETRYDRVLDLHWPECAACYAGWPSSKAERCLVEVFHLDPIPDLCRYAIRTGERARSLARRWLETGCNAAAGSRGRFPVVLIHYQGNTSPELKNLPLELARGVCDEVLDAGAVPVILDWDRRSPLPDGQRIRNPHVDLEMWDGQGTGDAEILAALIEMATLMVGVDSGPLHVAGATSTPTLGMWTGHHPLHYFSHADNVTHLVPANHADLLRGDRSVGEKYFGKHYRFEVYDDLAPRLRGAVRRRLRDDDGAMIFTRDFWVRAKNAEQDLVIVRDVAEEDTYKVAELPMPRPVVIDVGAHIGTFTKKVHQRNPLARILAVECCPENIPALKRNVGEFATVIQAAVTYDKDVALLSSVYPGCVSTGGSAVVRRELLRQQVERGRMFESPGPGTDSEFWADFRPLTTVTLEELLQQHGLDRIDVLKLDCEESEYSILQGTTLLDRIGMIVGEYHHRDKFLDLVRRRFPGWNLRVLKDADIGLFWLTNPHPPTPPTLPRWSA